MWDYTLYKFKCPYCDHEYEKTVGGGTNYMYKGKLYSKVRACPNCGEAYLDCLEEGCKNEFIKMPEDKSELEFHSEWIS